MDGPRTTADQPAPDPRLLALSHDLVSSFDVMEFALRATKYARLADADSSGVLLRTGDGLTLLAASSEDAWVVESFQAQHLDGPCVEAFRSSSPVHAADEDEMTRRWPHFSQVAVSRGLRSVMAVPLALRQIPIGAMGFFRKRRGPVGETDRTRLSALADMTAVAIVLAQGAGSHARTAAQLQLALDSRVVIEQAKGVVMAAAGLQPSDAFEVLRRYARRRGEKLTAVAEAVVNSRIDPANLL
ncbi:MAG TPA: GAF and ANTAR domain-containing protein [Actinomycetales bacterium]|nr:GAF and ANTAR domain-containing protein [Actinomycetales bacterium]